MAHARTFGFVVYFTAVACLLPNALHWDGVGFLIRSHELHNLDFAHVGYAPALRLFHWLTAPLGASPELAARLFSALGASVVFVLLWKRSEAMGLGKPAACACAALVVTTPLLWRQAGLVDPGVWMVASLLLSASAAESYGESRSVRQLVLACGALTLAAAFHVVAVVAIPWLVDCARGPAPAPPRRHSLVPLSFVAAVPLAGLLLEVTSGQVGGFVTYARGFLPAGIASTGEHVVDAVEFFMEGGPILLWLAILGIPLLRDRRWRRSVLWLGVPYLVAFVAVGKPFVGLLMPVFLALGTLVATAAHHLDRVERRPIPASVVLIVALVGQVIWSGREVIDRTRTPDPKLESATLLAAALPRSAVLFAGPLALHIRWLSEAQVESLPDLMFYAAAELGDDVDRARAILDEAERHAAAGRTVFITLEGLLYVDRRFGIKPVEIVPEEAQIIHVRKDPPLALARIAGPDQAER